MDHFPAPDQFGHLSIRRIALREETEKESLDENTLRILRRQNFDLLPGLGDETIPGGKKTDGEVAPFRFTKNTEESWG